MALVNMYAQPGFEKLHDAMALRRGSIQRMAMPISNVNTPQSAELINFRIYEAEPARKPLQQQAQRQSFVKRCSQLAHGRRPSIRSTYTAAQAPKVAQWVQRLPSDPLENDEFLESVLEEAVGHLVCGPNFVADEVELGYNYDTLEDVTPEAWVRVQARVVDSNGKSWIQASISSKVAPDEMPEIYAYGKWLLTKAKKHQR